MKMKGKKGILTDTHLAVAIVVAILFIDQIIKLWVKTNMCLGESIRVTDWFYINFVENNGMAYGMSFINKYVLTLFRIVVSGFIIYHIHKQIDLGARTRYIVMLCLVLAGALGNIIDCMFYGLIFNASSPYYVSYFVPFGSGYSGFLTGKVVDMFYFPLIVTTYPSWVPHFGGQEFIFFSPVFNFADACISVGMVLLLTLCRDDLSNSLHGDGQSAAAPTSKKTDRKEEMHG